MSEPTKEMTLPETVQVLNDNHHNLCNWEVRKEGWGPELAYGEDFMFHMFHCRLNSFEAAAVAEKYIRRSANKQPVNQETT